MPIRPENRTRYPKDWKALSLAAKERAGWKCQHQGCKTQQYEFGQWLRDGDGLRWLRWGVGSTYSEAKRMAAETDFDSGEQGPKPIVIVLTVAHLNHTPEDCRPENLAAMCQRHHLAYDAEHHKSTAYATRRASRATADLFEA